MNKIMTAEEAVMLVSDNDRIAASGFSMGGLAEQIEATLEKRFLETGHPRNLDLISLTEGGDFERNGYGHDHLAHEGMLNSITTAYFVCCPLIADMIVQNKIKAYNFPQGVIAAMFHSAIIGKPGELTKVGLNTFVDPRIEGGRLNDITKENIVEVERFRGEEWLFYPTPKLNIGLIRGTYADPKGNISLEDEIGPLDIALVAKAVKAHGGKVIAQVRYLAEGGTIPSRKVDIPGIFIDAVVVCENPEKEHRQTAGDFYNKYYAGTFIPPKAALKSMDMSIKKIMARRCAMELREGDVINLGIGSPEFVAQVVGEEGLANLVTMTAESGSIGGVPAGGKSFGACVGAEAFVSELDQFEFYTGGGLDVTILGLAQTDKVGNINVSKFGSSVTGCGGFIDLITNTHKIVYMGTFTTGGLRCEIKNGKLCILQEGKVRKFVNAVNEITYSGPTGAKNGQDVLYVTERAVFKLIENGMELIEIAPGIDLKKDILSHMDFEPKISENLKEMPKCIFEEPKIDLIKFWEA